MIVDERSNVEVLNVLDMHVIAKIFKLLENLVIEGQNFI